MARISDDRLARFLQFPTARESAVRRLPEPADLPVRVGPVEFSLFGAIWVAVRSPAEYAPLLRRAGATWEPGSRQWLVHRRRLGPLLSALRAARDPLFRQAGLDLDKE
jgi:hypothetical protein